MAASMIDRSCHACLAFNPGPTNGPPNLPMQASAPREKWLIDLRGYATPTEDGNRFILVAVDVYSRFFLLLPLKTKETAEVARGLNHLFTLAGTPATIVCDPEGVFKDQISDLAVRCRVQFTSPPARIKSAIGIVRRAIRTASELIDKLCRQHSTSWDRVTAIAMETINKRFSREDQCSPEELFHQRVVRRSDTPAEASASGRSTAKRLELGARVYTLSADLVAERGCHFKGPYFIAEHCDDHYYRVKDATGRVLREQFHISQVKRALQTCDESTLVQGATCTH